MKFHNTVRVIARPIPKFREHSFSAFLYNFSKYEELREENISSRDKDSSYEGKASL
jgi:hypothetical protein